MDKFKEQRHQARINLLNSKDFLSFCEVPKFIIDSFFEKCTYQMRLTVASFSFLNGLSCSQCFDLCFSRDMTSVDMKKIEDLYIYFKVEENAARFIHSQCIIKRFCFWMVIYDWTGEELCIIICLEEILNTTKHISGIHQFHRIYHSIKSPEICKESHLLASLEILRKSLAFPLYFKLRESWKSLVWRSTTTPAHFIERALMKARTLSPFSLQVKW